VLWLLSLAASVAVAALLLQFYRQSSAAQVLRGEAEVARACSAIKDMYTFFIRDWANRPHTDTQLRGGLVPVVWTALAHQNGIEGGIWSAGTGSLAYAFPTYPGTGPKTDVPEAELGRIRALNEQIARSGQPALSRTVARTQTLLLFACPLGGPVPDLTAWTMTRVEAAPAADRLRLGMGILFALMLAMTAWLTLLGLAWSRSVRRIETTLRAHAVEILPQIEPTGERELDRVVAALNETGQRLREARQRSDELAARAAAAERLAALGRVAAGVAHEIRNPIAAMRLKIENALAGDDERRRGALSAVLVQIARLDRLVAELLAMTAPREPRPADVQIPAFLAACVDEHRELAAARSVTLVCEAGVECARFDADVIARALGNLMLNAIQHAPESGRVTLSARQANDMLRFEAADTGPGIAPELVPHLFEPFVTGRAEGTGLGLAIARELAEAHGGRLVLLHAGGHEPNRGAAFALDLPWRPC
jgi:signal transduction histidine kinase